LLWYGLWFGRCAGFWFERGGRKRFVGEHANDEDGVAGADFVAVGESGFFDARSIEEGAVAALQVEKAAAFFTVFDGEVEAGHELVAGKGAIGFVRAANTERLARDQANLGACVRIGASFEEDLHSLSCTNSHAYASGQGRMQLARFPIVSLRASPHLHRKLRELPN